MPGGRPRKPRALKLVQGTDRPDRANARAPAPSSTPLPPPPKDLNAFEKSAWKQLAELIDPLRVATTADLVAFRQMVITLALVEQARDELKQAGSTTYEVISESGVSYRKRPELEVIATFQKILVGQLGRFGLTPAEREKVSRAGDAPTVDPLDEFAIGGGGAA